MTMYAACGVSELHDAFDFVKTPTADLLVEQPEISSGPCGRRLTRCAAVAIL